MKKCWILFFIVLFVFSVQAQELDDIITADSAVLTLKISSDLEIVPTSSNYAILYLEAKTSFYPKESSRQTLDSWSITPKQYETEENMLVFRWDQPHPYEMYSYEIEADVITTGLPVQVKKKIPFPREDRAYAEYVEPTEHIDSDAIEIRELANALIEGKDDYYDVVLTLAEWVHHNIHYNLSTLTADVSQPASWVLLNRNGVCDEMTSLFIAFLRAVNIPAKYVSGVSYTNSELFDYDFGPHGWAEVYFPEYGWIPFDVTYAEYGYVDASHVTLKESIDSGESSTYFGWRGRNVKVESSQLGIETEVISMGEQMEEVFDFVPQVIKKSVGFGSYNLVEATVTNLKNYYVPLALSLSKVENLEILSLNPQFELFMPGETKKIYWLVKVSNKLSPRFTYTFPISVFTQRMESPETSFKVMNEYPVFSREEMELLKTQRLEEFEKTYSQRVLFYCEPVQDVFYEDETPQIQCNLKNIGDVALNDVEVCVSYNCVTKNVEPESEEVFDFEFTLDEFGQKELMITAQNEDISKSDYVTIYLLKYPQVLIKSVEYPEEIEYGKEFNVKFLISGYNNPLDLKVNLHINRLSKTWRFDQLNIDREFIVKVDSRDLYPKDNNISIKVVYDDTKEKSYNVEKSFTMALKDLDFFTKIFLYAKMYLEKMLK